MPRLGLALFLAPVLLLASARSARADETDGVDEANQAYELPRTRTWHPWLLFDPFLAKREALFSGSYMREQVHGGPEVSGFGAAGGTTIATYRGPFFVRGQVTYGLRLLGGNQLFFGLGHYAYDAGLALGPVQIAARVGLAVADVHFGKGGFELGLFSPSVGASLSVHAARLRVGVVATSEYDWTWIGGPSTRIRGISLEIAFEGKPLPPPPTYHY